MGNIDRKVITQTGNIGNHQLFQDTYPLKITRKERVMSEGVDGEKVPVLRIGGQFQRAGLPNANGRIYPKDVLKKAVENIQEDVKARRVLAEFDHPPDAKIHLDRVSHLITKLWMEGDVVFGECEVLEKTTYGQELKALIESNVEIGISSRGVGDMEATIYEGEEYYQVLPGYSFVTFDCVQAPSVHGSYMAVVENKDILRKSVKSVKAEREKKILTEVKNLFRKK